MRGADIVPSPNIWYYPDVYELENRAQDVDGVLWDALAEETAVAGGDVLDIGAGLLEHGDHVAQRLLRLRAEAALDEGAVGSGAVLPAHVERAPGGQDHAPRERGVLVQ